MGMFRDPQGHNHTNKLRIRYNKTTVRKRLQIFAKRNYFMDIETIKAYYQARGLSWPAHKNALLFYLSEVGELAEAYLCHKGGQLSAEETDLLSRFVSCGLEADAIVSRVPGWIRNNDRLRKENIRYEAADCNMMLAVFLESYCGQSPDQALLAKMQDKLGGSQPENGEGAAE